MKNRFGIIGGLALAGILALGTMAQTPAKSGESKKGSKPAPGKSDKGHDTGHKDGKGHKSPDKPKQ